MSCYTVQVWPGVLDDSRVHHVLLSGTSPVQYMCIDHLCGTEGNTEVHAWVLKPSVGLNGV